MKKATAVVIGTVALFGVLVPLWKGLDFLDPVLLTVYGLLALLFAGPASAEAFAGERRPQTKDELLRRGALLTGYGWGVAVITVVAGLITVNAQEWHGRVLAPPGSFLLSVMLLSLTACAALVALCAWLGSRMTPRGMKSLMRSGFLVLLLGMVMASRFLSQETRDAIAQHMTTDGIRTLAWIGCGVCIAIAGGFVAALNQPRHV